MRRPLFELMSGYTDQLVKAVAAVGFYDHVIADIEKQKEEVLPTYRDFEKKINDQKYLGSLSVQEQQALAQNETNFKRLLRTMDETISHMMQQKWTQNIRGALWFLDELTLIIDDVLSGAVEDAGPEAKTGEIIPQKKFATADYFGRLAIIQVSINALRDDVLAEANFGIESDRVPDPSWLKFTVDTSLGKVYQLLQRDLEDMEANGLPTLHNFGVPKIVEPEIPDSPDDKKPDAKQPELPLEPKKEPEKVEA